MSQESVEIVRRAHAAWSAGDTEGAAALFDPAIRWHIAQDEPDAHVIEGIPGVFEWLRHWAASFDDFEVQTVEFIGRGDHVVVPQIFRGRGRNTAAVLEVEETQVYLVQAGKVVEVRSYRTLDEALEAVGLPSPRF
jgi:ketosteroid isomerase-like protein